MQLEVWGNIFLSNIILQLHKAFRSEVSQIFSDQTLGAARVYYVFLPTLFNYKIVIIKTHEKETSICL